MPAYPIVSLLLAAGSSAALALMAPAEMPHGPRAVHQVQAGSAEAPAAKKGRAGAKVPGSEAAITDTLASCLGMWEPATHMSKREWARACRRVDQRLRNITAK